jgi:hypothetical protein
LRLFKQTVNGPSPSQFDQRSSKLFPIAEGITKDVRALDNPVEEIAKPNVSFHQLLVIIPLCKYSIFPTFVAYRTQIFPLSLYTGFPFLEGPSDTHPGRLSRWFSGHYTK